MIEQSLTQTKKHNKLIGCVLSTAAMINIHIKRKVMIITKKKIQRGRFRRGSFVSSAQSRIPNAHYRNDDK